MSGERDLASVRVGVAVLGTLLLGVSVSGCGPGARPEKEPGTAASAYFVRVTADADPEAVARSHGITPDTVLVDGVRAFRGRFDRDAARRLEDDPRVESVSVRIEGEDWRPREPVTVPDSQGAGARAVGG